MNRKLIYLGNYQCRIFLLMSLLLTQSRLFGQNAGISGYGDGLRRRRHRLGCGDDHQY